MFTRCPQCKTVHTLTAQKLSHAHGAVKCGQCGYSFSALNFLFDQWPSGQAYGQAAGSNIDPPVIGTAIWTKDKAEEPEQAEPDESDPDPHRLAWRLATAFLVLVFVINIGWTFRTPLMQYPSVRSWLKNNGWLQNESGGLLKDPGDIQLISRDMHSHPTRTGVLVLSLTIVNLARRSQVFPILEITLLDGSNQPIAQRQFQPGDYLRPGANTKSGMGTDVFLPVLLELVDPGEQAVGFEIQFL